MNNLIFILFYNVLYFSGRRLVLFLKPKSFENFFENQVIINSLFPIFSLFFLGNTNLILNFFIPLKTSALITTVLFLFMFIFELKEYIKNKFKDFDLMSLIFIPLIISFSSYGIKFHYDAGAYHLDYQLWIYENKITIGLANLNPYFSYGSIQEYIYSTFRYFDINLLYFFIDITFIATFFSFLYVLLKQNKNNFLKYSSFFILIFLILDNFGYMGGANGSIQIQMAGKADTAVGVLWTICSILIINAIIKKNTSQFEFFIILMLSLFAFQLKSNAGPLVFLIVIYMFKYKNKLKILTIENSLLFLLNLLFLIKNFLVSGCFLYPLSFSCIRIVNWLNFQHIYESSQITINRNKRFVIGENFIDSFNAFINHAYNLQIYLNFIFSLIIIYLIKFLFFENIHKNYKIKIYYLVFMIANFLLFFLTVPAFRQGYGLFLSILIIFSIDNIRIKNQFEKIFNKKSISILIILVVFLSPRFFMYSEAINNRFKFKDFSPEKVEYTQDHQNFVIPISTNQCWGNKNCILKTQFNNKIKSQKSFSYLIFTSSK